MPYCHALIYLGIVAAEQGHLHKAIDYFEQGLVIAEEHQLHRARSLLIGNLGAAYGDLGEYRRAHTYQRRKLELALLLGLWEDSIFALTNLGTSYASIEQITHAQQYYHAALARMQILEPRLLGDLLVKLGTVAKHLGDTMMRDQYYIRAIAVCRAFDIRFWLIEALYDQANYKMEQRCYTEAQIHNTEVLALATQFQIEWCQFPCRVRDIHLQVLLGQLDRAAALAQLEDLGRHATEPQQQALIESSIWRIDPAHEQARVAAAAQYRALYTQNPNIHDHKHYHELTGEDLPAPPPLPDPPSIVYQHTVDIPAFFARVDTLLAAQGAQG